MALQSTVSRLPKNAQWIARHRPCQGCQGRAVGILMTTGNDAWGPVCEACGKIALAGKPKVGT
jgi:cytochrome c5